MSLRPPRGPNLASDIAGQIRQMLLSGLLGPGDRLPSTRALAADLDVARGTVVAALETLIAEGFLQTRRGAGTFVETYCQRQAAVLDGPREPPARTLTITPDIDPSIAEALNFQACRPSMEAFPQSDWRRATADAAGRLPSSDYGDPRGELALRIAVASYLCRARGLDVSADQILITNGAMQAMHVLARVYLTADHAVAMEDPGYPLARQMFATTGAKVIPIAVDEEGFCVDVLPADGGNIKLIYVTPSHQFPTGERLSLARRQALLAFAARHQALIMEDDYDGEFRYDVPPLPPMAAMSAGGSVVYFGTFSKTMFPSLRIGYAVGSETLIAEMGAYRAITDYQTNSLAQLSLARFIERGEFEKHVHRMRRIYARKRATLARAIEKSDWAATLCGTDSGLNALVRLRGDINATSLCDRARLEGIGVTPIARYTRALNVPDDALVLGYAALDEAQIEQGIAMLAAISRHAR
ncbi:MAG: PLP-dependent aminotransferase family protein [Gammaproteobacteria bacterium]